VLVAQVLLCRIGVYPHIQVIYAVSSKNMKKNTQNRTRKDRFLRYLKTKYVGNEFYVFLPVTLK
jgi:hypothetical protein